MLKQLDVPARSIKRVVIALYETEVNVVAIASLKELAAIVLVKGIEPGKEVVEKAEEEGIPLLGTMDDTFTLTEKLYQLLR